MTTSDEQPTDRWLLAVEAQRTAVEHFTRTVAWAIAKHGRVKAIGATYAEFLDSVRQDPTSYAAVLVMALVKLAENAKGGGPQPGPSSALGGGEGTPDGGT